MGCTMPAMVSKNLIRACFLLSTLYTIFILAIFVTSKNSTIPLTFRNTVFKWGDLQQLMREHPLSLPQNKLDAIFTGWCPKNANSMAMPISPQCSCINNFYFTFTNNSAAFIRGDGPKDLAALGELQATGVIGACLRQRTTWRKDTCSHFCQMHLAVPILVASLCMSLFFSRITDYQSSVWATLSAYFPVFLAVLVIIINFVVDALAAIPAVLTIVSALMEMTFACYCVEGGRVFWSFQRFFMGSIAVWAAVTHQGRDMYVVSAFAVLGFFIGMLAYTQYIMRFKQGCNRRMRVVSIYAWVGICVISASLFLMVQQHWYQDSPVWSSLVSVACLAITCVQCIAMVPGVRVSDSLQLAVGLVLLSLSVLTVGVDVLSR